MVNEPLPPVEKAAAHDVAIEKVAECPEPHRGAPVDTIVPPARPFGLRGAAPACRKPAARGADQIVGLEARVAGMPFDPPFERAAVLVQQIGLQPRGRPLYDQVLVHPPFLAAGHPVAHDPEQPDGIIAAVPEPAPEKDEAAL